MSDEYVRYFKEHFGKNCFVLTENEQKFVCAILGDQNARHRLQDGHEWFICPTEAIDNILGFLYKQMDVN